MAGLLDTLSPEVLGLLKGTSGEQPGGLLGAGGTWGTGYQRNPNEGFLDTIFGSNDPRDPRGQAMMALSLGLMRGNFADGIEGSNKVFTDARDRAGKDRVAQLGLLKTGLELDGVLDSRKKDRSISSAMQRLDEQEQTTQRRASFAPLLDPQPTDNYGTPGYGGESMFSMLGAGPYSTGPAATYQPPQPRGGMAGAVPQQPSSLMVGTNATRGDGAQATSPTQTQYQRMLAQAKIYEQHGRQDMALKLYDAAKQFQTEYSTEFRQVVDPVTRRLVNVQVAKDGTIRPVPYGVKPDISLENLGGRTVAIDKNDAQGGQAWDRTMTPGEVASNRVAQGNLTLSRERLELDRNSPQYMQTDDGLIALPRRPGAGPIVGRPVTGEDGQPFRPPLKQIPPSANTAIVTNAQNLKRAQDALTLIRGGTVGTAQGDPDATGWKGYLPDAVLNRADKAGVNARAAIGDLGSMIIHDRSGAAVTAAESPRLKPFIPLVTDSPEVAAQKLERFVQIYEQEAEALGEIYSKGQGYRPSPVLQRNAQTRDERPAQAQPLPIQPSASNLRVGQTYTLPNGKTGKWDGLQFKVQK